MKDQGFPLIKYAPGATPQVWGQTHGEQQREAIKELCNIRTHLLQLANPALKGQLLNDEALKQWQFTREFSEPIWQELEGIRQGAGLSVTDIVVVNNYTDFRDITVTDEGCSTIYARRAGQSYAGQTWDMHSTARNFVCAIEIPAHQISGGQQVPATVVFSLVGCVGLTGYNSQGAMIGVNNLNGTDARAGIVWPALVRKCLEAKTVTDMSLVLKTAAVTSAHNYLIADRSTAEMWEVFPTLRNKQAMAAPGKDATIFHTNHCLSDSSKTLEVALAVASTSRERLALLEKKADSVGTIDSLYALLTDHENYPKSICSHFESGAQDPSATCGGVVGDLNTGTIKLWRGCPVYDKNYVEHTVQLTS